MEPSVTDTAAQDAESGEPGRRIRRKSSGTGLEPALPADVNELRRAVSQFVRTGGLPASSPLRPGLEGRLPALVHQALVWPSARSPYPVVLEATASGLRVRPFGELIDELAAAGVSDGDDAELQRHFLGRVEATVRAESAPDPSLSLAWKNACDAVSRVVRESRQAEFKAFVTRTSARLPKQASLLNCEPETARMVARAIEERLATERGRDIVEEAETLRATLASLVEVEKESSHDAVAPDRLRRAVGGAMAAEFDFNALSSLLDEAPHAPGLAPDRKSRIEMLVAELGHASTFFSSEVVCRLDEARDRMDEQTGRLALLLRSLESARLEVVNRFRPDVHGVLFSGYTSGALSAEDLERCPPVLVEVDEASMNASDLGSLLGLLSDRRPFKVLLTTRNVPGTGSALASVPQMAVGLGTSFVAQVALSDVPSWTTALERGLAFAGPSLFAFHAGGPDHGRLTPYLSAAAARDGRAVPSFLFDPTPGSVWADRLDVGGNENPEADWLGTRLTVEGTDGSIEESSSVFTWLDFAACLPVFDREFLPLAPDDEPEGLVPAERYLAMDRVQQARAFPYVLTVTPDGELEKAVLTARLADAAASALDRWRRLKELGSIDNSFAARARSAAQVEYSAERDAAISRLKGEHAAEMDRAVAALAETIVSNIAASLLDLEPGSTVRPMPGPIAGTASPATAAALTTGSAPTPAPAAIGDAGELPQAPGEPEEEPLVLDEAYIETPRCTSCNECVQLNGMIFAYNGEKQAYIKNPAGGPFRDLVTAAEKCPVRIIHPGKPSNPAEPGLEDLLERAKAFR